MASLVSCLELLRCGEARSTRTDTPCPVVQFGAMTVSACWDSLLLSYTATFIYGLVVLCLVSQSIMIGLVLHCTLFKCTDDIANGC